MLNSSRPCVICSFHNGADGVPAHQEMGDVEEVLKRGLGRSPVGHIVPRHALQQRKVEIVFIVVVQSIVSSRSGPHGGHVLQTVELVRIFTRLDSKDNNHNMS